MHCEVKGDGIMKKHIREIIIVLLVAIIAGLLIYIGNLRVEEDRILGTYKSGETYIVLDHEGGYLKYQQFKVLEKGSHKEHSGHIVEVTREDGQIFQMLRTAEGLVVYEEGTMCLYEHTDDTPVYINIEHE